MIYQIYMFIFLIVLVFLYFGYNFEIDILKIVSYGILFTLGLMLFQPLFYGNVETCEYLNNFTNNIQIYGANYTGYHTDYEYDFSPSEDGVRLFHVYEEPTYSYTCQDIENKFLGFWIAVLGFLGFMSIFYDIRNNKEDND